MSKLQLTVNSLWESRSLAFVAAAVGATENGKVAVEAGEKQRLVLADGSAVEATDVIAKELVRASNGLAKTLLGVDAEERAQVTSWISWLARSKNDSGSVELALAELNTHLRSNTYVAMDRITLADILIFHAFHPVLESAPPKKMTANASVIRWLDSFQHSEFFVAGRDYVPPLLKLVQKYENGVFEGCFDVSSAAASKVEESSSSSSSSSPSSSSSAAASASAAAATAPATKKTKLTKAERKAEKKKKKQQQKQTANPEASASPEFHKILLKVGRLAKIWEHPDSTKLWCEEVELGEEKPRQVASGLREHFTKEQMLGRLVVVVCNLKPAKLAGFASAGMVLCAKNDAGKIEFLDVPEGAQVGERIFLEGEKVEEMGEPWSQGKVKKKKVWEAVAKDLRTCDALTAQWQGKNLVTSAGPIRVASNANNPIS